MSSTVNHEISTSIDLNKVAALQQKRTLAFVNHFVISTVQFLNNFAKQCEQKLMQFERKLEKINATMVLLEAKLSSIPEVNIEPENPKSENLVNVINETEEKQYGNQKTETKPVIGENADVSNHTDLNVNKVKPEYERFVKMVQVGVPKDAVKLKISLEGLDPNELDKIL